MELLKKLSKVIGVFLLGVIIATIVCIGPKACNNIIHSKSKINYVELAQLKQAELKYWETKAELTEEVDAYIRRAAPTSALSAAILVDKCEEYGVDIKFVLAQGYQESHFGTRGLGAKINSPWNVGVYDGMTYADIHKKHIFDNPNESIDRYLELLTTKYLTTKKTELDLLNSFVSVDGKRYASSTTYESSLKYKYEDVSKTTKIDSLQQVLRYWTIQSNREY